MIKITDCEVGNIRITQYLDKEWTYDEKSKSYFKNGHIIVEKKEEGIDQ